MKPPDRKITGAAGLLVGLAISGLLLGSPPGVDLAVQTIELREGLAQPSVDPMLPVDDVKGPTPMYGASPSPTQVADDAPSSAPIVVAPQVVSERPRATPRATPKAIPKPVATDDDDDDDDDDEDDDDDDDDDD